MWGLFQTQGAEKRHCSARRLLAKFQNMKPVESRVRVAARFRPFLEHESNHERCVLYLLLPRAIFEADDSGAGVVSPLGPLWCSTILKSRDNSNIMILIAASLRQPHRFFCCPPRSAHAVLVKLTRAVPRLCQDEVYASEGRPLVEAVFEGLNTTLFCYGATLSSLLAHRF